MFWPRQSLGLGSSYRHLGLAAARTKVTRKSRKKLWGSGQLEAEVFCPSCSDRPGRAWVKEGRALELFLLTLRPQVSSGQPPPLPEPLPSSPGGGQGAAGQLFLPGTRGPCDTGSRSPATPEDSAPRAASCCPRLLHDSQTGILAGLHLCCKDIGPLQHL